MASDVHVFRLEGQDDDFQKDFMKNSAEFRISFLAMALLQKTVCLVILHSLVLLLDLWSCCSDISKYHKGYHPLQDLRGNDKHLHCSEIARNQTGEAALAVESAPEATDSPRK